MTTVAKFLVSSAIVLLLVSLFVVGRADQKDSSLVEVFHLAPRHIVRDKVVIRGVATRKKVAAFTFDADPVPQAKPGFDTRVIEILRQRQVPATFFLTGRWIEQYPDETRALAADPLFELANHSYSHHAFKSDCFGLPEIPDSQDFTEIKKTEELLNQYAGEGNYQKFFRFPEFCYESYDLQVVSDFGYKIVHGNVPGRDTLFWEPTVSKIVDNVMASSTPGGIIILHMQGAPSAPYTATALPRIIDNLEGGGYRFVKVSELLKLR